MIEVTAKPMKNHNFSNDCYKSLENEMFNKIAELNDGKDFDYLKIFVTIAPID